MRAQSPRKGSGVRPPQGQTYGHLGLGCPPPQAARVPTLNRGAGSCCPFLFWGAGTRAGGLVQRVLVGSGRGRGRAPAGALRRAHLLLAQPYNFLPGACGGRSFLPGESARSAGGSARSPRRTPQGPGAMEAVWLAGLLWALALVLPAVLVTALCIGCRDASSPAHGAQAVADYEYKPPPCVSHNSFMVLTRASYPARNQIKQQPVGPAEQFLSIPRSPQMPQSRQVSSCRTETDNDSVPSYENQEGPRAGDDDDDYNNELYATGYVEVLPDSITEPSAAELGTSKMELRDSVSSVAPADDYENVPEAQRQSLADSLEYINMPESGSSLPDDRCGSSNRESEDDCPDYENLHR